ncbi:MobC family plasmid mobilization relaxosome protein [Dysosmobacter sp.]
MRTRNKRVEVYFSEEEYRHFRKNVALSGFDVSTYVRFLVNGHNLKARPTEEFSVIRHQLSAIGNNLNQIAKVANYSHTVSAEDATKIEAARTELWNLLHDL